MQARRSALSSFSKNTPYSSLNFFRWRVSGKFPCKYCTGAMPGPHSCAKSSIILKSLIFGTVFEPVSFNNVCLHKNSRNCNYQEKMKLIFNKELKFLWKKGDMHTNLGMIKEQDIKKLSKVTTNKGAEFFVAEATFLDLVRKIKRGPQTLLPKDLAIIAYYTGVDKKSKVLDAGAGCGLLASVMGRLAKSVITCDIHDGSLEIAKANIAFLGLKNVKIKKHDVYASLPEKKLDIITLDVPEPWHVFSHTKDALNPGGRVMTYLPTIVQVEKAVREAEKNQLFHVKTIEVLEREWHVEGRKVRPMSQMIGHSAFLSFFRKVA